MTEAEPTVFVVDDDAAVGDAIRLLLKSVGLRSEVYSSATDFLQAYDQEQPGCLILDVRMPGMSGLDLQRRLQELGSKLPIIFVTAHGDVPMAVNALKAGAADFIQKPFRDQDLLDKIQDALKADRTWRTAETELDEIRSQLASLTPREEEVMELVVAGKPNKNIARTLGISQRTVEIHRARVMEKMRARSVPMLVQKVMKAEEGK